MFSTTGSRGEIERGNLAQIPHTLAFLHCFLDMLEQLLSCAVCTKDHSPRLCIGLVDLHHARGSSGHSTAARGGHSPFVSVSSQTPHQHSFMSLSSTVSDNFLNFIVWLHFAFNTFLFQFQVYSRADRHSYGLQNNSIMRVPTATTDNYNIVKHIPVLISFLINFKFITYIHYNVPVLKYTFN